MSLQAKVSAAKELVALYTKWPAMEKVYASFRDERIAYYTQDQPSKLPAAQTLELRVDAVKNLTTSTHMNRFPVSDDLKHPDGNTGYYSTIMREAQRQNKKNSRFTAMKETTFGWFK